LLDVGTRHALGNGLVTALGVLLLVGCKKGAPSTAPNALDASAGFLYGAAARPGAELLISADNRVQCVAKGAVLYRRGYETSSEPRRTEFDAPLVSVSCGQMNICAVTTKHDVWCLGDNHLGEIGAPTSEECELGPCSRVPVRVPGIPPMVDVATRAMATCGLGQAGGVFCWGWRGAAPGEGPGMLAERVSAISGVRQATQVAVGSRFACALTREGEVWCWGLNSWGQLGRGSASEPLELLPPAKVAGLGKATAIGAGLSHACAILREGVACWGLGTSFQTALDGEPCDVTVTCTPSPRLVPLPAGLEPALIDLDGNSSCVLMKTGELYCWGQDVNLTLGAKPDQCITPCVKHPRKIEGIPPLMAISHGWSHTCGLSRDGSLVCWGGLEEAGLATASPMGEPPACAGCVGPVVRLDVASFP
jgi:alpha-tubulin suppressor-like RCC1 family protein